MEPCVFCYESSGGKIIVVRRLEGRRMLVNGAVRYGNFDKIKEEAKKKPHYAEFTAEELEEKRHKRYDDYNSNDYELRGTGKGKSVYRPRRSKDAIP
jgi:hypothetical protein